MRFIITSDSSLGAGLGKINIELMNAFPLRELISKTDYGFDLIGFCIVMMCRDYDFKQRIRFSKAEKTLYMDIMFPYAEMVAMTPEQRRRLVAHKLREEVPVIVRKYQKKIADFKMEAFLADFDAFIVSTGWLELAAS